MSQSHPRPEKIPFEGGCRCGAVRFRVDAAPVRTFLCHCRDCQKATGGPFNAAMLVPKNALVITKGEPVWHAVPSTRGGTNGRGFCGVCGSRLFGGKREEGPTIGITVSSLDDRSWYRPTVHVFVSQKEPWDTIEDGLPQFDTYPPLPAPPLDAH